VRSSTTIIVASSLAATSTGRCGQATPRSTISSVRLPAVVSSSVATFTKTRDRSSSSTVQQRAAV
jgi:hypothetical protein